MWPGARLSPSFRPALPRAGNQTEALAGRSSASQTRPGCPGPRGLLGATAPEAGVTTDPPRLVAAAVLSWASRFRSGP